VNLLREYIRVLVEKSEGEDPVREDRMKVSQMFWNIGAGMGIRLAEMTPGLEDLAAEFEEFRILVEEFIDLSERFMAQPPKDSAVQWTIQIRTIKKNIQTRAAELHWHRPGHAADKELDSAHRRWVQMFLEALRWAHWTHTQGAHAHSDQEEYEALKDWIVV